MYNEITTLQAAAANLALTKFCERNTYQLTTRERVDPVTNLIKSGKYICITPRIIATYPAAGSFADLLQNLADDIRSEIKLLNRDANSTTTTHSTENTANIKKTNTEEKAI